MEGFGVQTIAIPAKDDPITVRLAPVGRIDGRLVAPHGEPIRGVVIRATSQVGGYAGSGQGGLARAACDEQGRFTIPAIAAGLAALEIEFDPETSPPLRGEAPRGIVVKAGRATEVTIPLRETLVVRGLVRERGTDRPIAGVKVVLNGYFGGDRFAMTGADGRFAGRIRRDAGQPYGWPIRIPVPYYVPADTAYPAQRMPRPGVAELELAPIVLRRGVDVRGTVAGEDGKPVAGAWVEAIWHHAEEVPSGSATARTDRAGAFVLHGVDPIAELNLTAWDRFAASPPTTIRAAATEHHPIALTISPKESVPIGGRVVDPAGRPIADAEVRLWRRVRDPQGVVAISDPAAAGEGSFLTHTDADGRFRTRGRLPSRADYAAEATAPGRLAARSPVIAAGPGPDRPTVLVLRRIRSARGRVVDRRGRPVAGALVRQRGDGPMPTEAHSEADGRFQLPGVIEGPALVLAEKPGFRASLQPADHGSKPVEIVLTRTDEPPATAYRSILSALTVEEEKALARALLRPLVTRVLARGDDDARFLVLRDAADVDPASTIEWLDEAKFGDPESVDMLRLNLAAVVAHESLDEGMAILEASRSAYWRATGYVAILDETPGLAADRKRALLDQAIVNSKTATSPSNRFTVLGEIANRLIDLGDFERARSVLREGQELTRSIAPGDQGTRLALVSITDALARLDLPAALKIVEGLEADARKNESGDRGGTYEFAYAGIARKLADRSPAEAEKVLERISLRPSNDREILPVCYRMAPVDLARARRIAAGRISSDTPALRPYAVGLMARAIAATDHAAAVRLLDEAFDELGRLAEVEAEYREPAAEVAAGALLPVVERVEPDRLGEFLARAVLMRRPRGDRGSADERRQARSTALLAMMVARYDRDLAGRVLQPELEAFGSSRSGFGVDRTTPSALALIDPRRAVAMVEALPDDPAPGTDPYGARNWAIRSVAKVMALHEVDRWRDVFLSSAGLWTPDQRYW